jgi:hypothetical protein
MTDIVERLRSMEVFIMTSANVSPVAYESAAEIERLRAQVAELQQSLNFAGDNLDAAFARGLAAGEAQVATARADALEEAAKMAEYYMIENAKWNMACACIAAAIRQIKPAVIKEVEGK